MALSRFGGGSQGGRGEKRNRPLSQSMKKVRKRGGRGNTVRWREERIKKGEAALSE